MDTIPTHEETGSVDRFEGTMAVLIVGDPRRIITVDRTQLADDIREGTWIRVTTSSDGTVRIVADPAATEAARSRIAEKLARLRRGDHLQPPAPRDDPDTEAP